MTLHTALYQLRLQQWQAALETLKALEENSSNESPDIIQYYLGICSSKLGAVEKAQQYLHQAIKINPALTEAYGELSNLYLQQEDWRNALTACLHGLKRDNQWILLHQNKGIALYHLGQYHLAAQTLQDAIDRGIQSSLVYKVLALAYAAQGKIEKSRTYFAQAGAALIQTGALEQGLNFLDESKTDSDTSFQYYLGLGIKLQAKGDLTSAKHCLQEATHLNPNSSVAYNQLGLCYLAEDNFAAALESLEQAQTLDHSNDVKIQINIGTCYYYLRQLDLAIKTLLPVLNQKPDSLETYCFLGKCWLEKGEPQRAAEYFQRVADRHTEAAELLYRISYVHRDQGNISLSLQGFQDILTFGNLVNAFNSPDLTGTNTNFTANLSPNLESEPLQSQVDPRARNGMDSPYHKTLRIINQIQGCQQAGYFPKLSEGYKAWDAMLLRDRDRYLLFYLMGPSNTKPYFWCAGDMALATSTDLKTWDYHGPILQPDPNLDWCSGRILAGSIYQEDGTYYLFYSAASKDSILHERMGLGRSQDGIHWKFDEQPFLEIAPQHYSCRPAFHPGIHLLHTPWRDPYLIKDPQNSQYYLFFTANAHNPDSDYQGCIGCATASHPAGPYTTLPPVLYPLLPGTTQGIYIEMERPQVILHQNRYYLAFSTAWHLCNPQWREQHQNQKSTWSPWHWYVAEHLLGPYEPAHSPPWIQSPSIAETYGFSLVEAENGSHYACGMDAASYTLVVPPQIPIRWNQGQVEILHADRQR